MTSFSQTRAEAGLHDIGQPSDVSTGRPKRAGRSGKRRAVVTVGVVVIVVAAGVSIFLVTRRSSSAAALTVTTESVPVTTGTMQQTVAASGTIAPGNEADLDFAVSGKVVAVKVATGDKVTAGETLATVNPSALRSELEAARASLSAAQAKLATDQAAVAVASQIDSDTAAVTSADTQLATAKTDLADAKLTSTINGTVASVDLAVGQVVSASTGGSSATGDSSSSGGTATSATAGSAASAGSSSSNSSSASSAQVTVIDTKSYTLSTTVDDTEVGSVKVGDQAVITPGSSTTAVYGTVSSVGLIASSSSDVATFPVTIAITGSPSGLYAGATATVSIVTEQLDNVVEVPTAAISYTTGRPTVTLVDGTRYVSTAITTGVSSSGETQVTKGVRAGDKLIERVVKFNGAGGGAKSLFGGTTGTGRRGLTGGGGGFGGGGLTGGGGGGFGA